MDVISDRRESSCIRCLLQNPDCSVSGVSYKWENRILDKTLTRNLEKAGGRCEQELEVDEGGFFFF